MSASFARVKPFILIVLLLALAASLIGCKEDPPAATYNVSGRVLHAEKDVGIEGVTIWAVSGR